MGTAALVEAVLVARAVELGGGNIDSALEVQGMDVVPLIRAVRLRAEAVLKVELRRAPFQTETWTLQCSSFGGLCNLQIS